PSGPELSTLKLAELSKGGVEPQDVPDRLATAMVTRRNLQDFAQALRDFTASGQRVGRFQFGEDVRTNTPTWYGIQSMLPKPLQQGYGYDQIARILERGLAGEELAPGQQRYFSELYAWARQNDGPLSPLDLEVWINEHGLGLKQPTVLEQTEREALQSSGEGSIEFEPTTLESRAPAGASKTLLEKTPSGDLVRPLLPPDPELRLEADRLVRSIAGGEDQPTAEALASLYGIQAKVQVQRGGVRVPETRLEGEGGTFEPGTLLVRLPADAEPYQLAHEIMFEGRKAVSQDYTLPEHDDNLIAARLVGDLR